MILVFIGIVALLGALAMFAEQTNQGNSGTQPENGPSGNVETGGITPSPAVAPVKVGPSQFDDLILQYANDKNLDPVLIKAIIAKESYFDSLSTNPEKSGISASRLRREITADPSGGFSALSKYSIDPSLGLMQVRVSTAQQFFPSIRPVDLYDPAQNIDAGTSFLAWLVKNGITLDTIQAYNEGLGAEQRGIPDAAYQADVANYYSQFHNDFSS